MVLAELGEHASSVFQEPLGARELSLETQDAALEIIAEGAAEGIRVSRKGRPCVRDGAKGFVKPPDVQEGLRGEEACLGDEEGVRACKAGSARAGKPGLLDCLGKREGPRRQSSRQDGAALRRVEQRQATFRPQRDAPDGFIEVGEAPSIREQLLGDLERRVGVSAKLSHCDAAAGVLGPRSFDEPFFKVPLELLHLHEGIGDRLELTTPTRATRADGNVIRRLGARVIAPQRLGEKSDLWRVR